MQPSFCLPPTVHVAVVGSTDLHGKVVLLVRPSRLMPLRNAHVASNRVNVATAAKPSCHKAKLLCANSGGVRVASGLWWPYVSWPTFVGFVSSLLYHGGSPGPYRGPNRKK